MSNDPRCRRGLTLIELTAMVAALAVLAAVLTPALADVRRRGKDTVCLQNLARIARASIVYASQDPDEQAVPVHPAAGYEGYSSSTIIPVLRICYGGKSGRGRWNGMPFFWGTGFGRGPASRPMNVVMYKGGFPDYSGPPYGNYMGSDAQDRWHADETLDLSVYRCPSDSGYTGYHYLDWKVSGLSSYDFFGNSYHANTMWIGCGPGSYLSSNAPFMHRLSDVVSPRSTLYYQEHCSTYAQQVAPAPSNCYYDPPTAIVNGWHGQAFRFNAAFVDAHVDQVRIRGFENPRIGRYPGYADPDAGYMHWRCVIMRGPGWQMDTLPLPPVETGMIWRSAGGAAPGRDDSSDTLRPVIDGPLAVE